MGSFRAVAGGRDSMPVSSKYSVLLSTRKRTEKLLSLKGPEFAAKLADLLKWTQQGGRSPVLPTERRALQFAFNRIESVTFAFNEGDISASKYRSELSEAVTLLQDAIKKMKAREVDLKKKALNDPDESVSQRKLETRQVADFAELREAFQQNKRQMEEESARENKTSGATDSKIIAEDDVLAAKSLVILSRYQDEKKRIVKKIETLKGRTGHVQLQASIMVRMEGVIPTQLKMMGVRPHNIGSGFYIFERQTLVAFSEGSNIVELPNLKQVRDDYYFVESELPLARQLRWFTTPKLYKYMSRLHFSQIAFPWSGTEDTKRTQSPASAMAQTKDALSLRAKREIIERVVDKTPRMAELKAKIEAKEKLVNTSLEEISKREHALAQMDSQIEGLRANRDTHESALKRRKVDHSISLIEKNKPEVKAQIEQWRETLKTHRGTLNVLKREYERIRGDEHNKLLLKARKITSEGKRDKNEAMFENALLA